MSKLAYFATDVSYVVAAPAFKSLLDKCATHASYSDLETWYGENATCYTINGDNLVNNSNIAQTIAPELLRTLRTKMNGVTRVTSHHLGSMIEPSFNHISFSQDSTTLHASLIGSASQYSDFSNNLIDHSQNLQTRAKLDGMIRDDESDATLGFNASMYTAMLGTIIATALVFFLFKKLKG